MEVRRLKPKPKIHPLDRKIKPNPRYSKVENVVDTGNNLRKELERLEEVHQFYKFRHDEVFRRVNINNLVSLIVEQTKLEYQLNPPLSLRIVLKRKWLLKMIIILNLTIVLSMN